MLITDIHIIPCTGYKVPAHIHDMFRDTFYITSIKKMDYEVVELLERENADLSRILLSQDYEIYTKE
jgi:hypothetical protein